MSLHLFTEAVKVPQYEYIYKEVEICQQKLAIRFHCIYFLISSFIAYFSAFLR